MRRYDRDGQRRKQIFAGVDLHRQRWHLTIRTEDEELFSGSIEGSWAILEKVLDRYRGYDLKVAICPDSK